MNSKKINRQFQAYIDSLPSTKPFRDCSDRIATLFGSDAVKIDKENSRVKLPEFGWVTVDHVVPKKHISWAAVIRKGEDFYLTLVTDILPFSDKAKDLLPTEAGVILAVPFLDSANIKDKMIAT